MVPPCLQKKYWLTINVIPMNKNLLKILLQVLLLLLPATVSAQVTIYKYAFSGYMRCAYGGSDLGTVQVRISGTTPAFSKGVLAQLANEGWLYSSTRPTVFSYGSYTEPFVQSISYPQRYGATVYYTHEEYDPYCNWPSVYVEADYYEVNVAITNTNPKVTYCEEDVTTLTLPDNPSSVRWTVRVDNGGTETFRQGTGTLQITFDDIKAFIANRGSGSPYSNFIFAAEATYGTITATSPVTNAINFVAGLPRPTSIAPEAPACFNGTGKLKFNDIRYPDGQVFNGSEEVYFKVRNTAGSTVTDYRMTGNSMEINLPSGTYEIKASKPGGNCIWEYPGTVTIGAAPTEMSPSYSLLCYNGTPAVTLSATNGTAPYQFNINGIVNPPDNRFTNLTPGATYNAVVTDRNGCSKTVSITMRTAVTVTRGLVVVPGGTAANGRVTLNAAGGSGAPYMYSRDGVNWQTSATFTGLAAGAYRFWTRDGAGCVSPVPLDITLQAIDFSTATQVASCSDASDGSITVRVTGGVAPYSYKLDNGIYIREQPVFTFLSAGTYELAVQDANGAIVSKTVTVGGPPPMLITQVATTDAYCKDMANGIITITAEGGNGGYTYYINSGSAQTIPTFSVRAGNYIARVVDSKGCAFTAPSVTIREPAVKVKVTTKMYSAICYTTATGKIEVTGTDGAPPYEYKIDDENWQLTPAFDLLMPRQYQVYAKDAQGCESTVTNVVVDSPPELKLQEDSNTPASCYGARDGTVSISAAGGVGNIRYYISSEPSRATNGTFTGLAAGDYTVTVLDDSNCGPVESLVVHIAQPDPVMVDLSVTDVLCYGQSNGAIQITNITGGNGEYLPAINNIDFSAKEKYDLLSAGEYTIYIKDKLGCRGEKTTMIHQLPVVAFDVTGTDALCTGSATGTLSITPRGGTGTYTYSIDGGVFVSTPDINALTAGSKMVVVKDGNNCQLSKSFLIDEPAPLTLVKTDAGKVSCYSGSDGSLTVKAAGGTAPYVYACNGSAFQDAAVFTGLRAGTYSIVVKDNKGCISTITEAVEEFTAIGMQIINTTDVLCAGAATGVIELEGTGGAGNYRYSLDGTDFRSVSRWEHLMAGTHTLIIRDGNACTANFSVAIIDLYMPLMATLSSQPPATCDDRGAITVNSTSGGLSPYTYSLDDNHYQEGTTFDQLLNGDYTVYIKDVNGCLITRSISPYGPVTIRAQVMPTHVLCNGNATGVLEVQQVTGGENRYEYSLDGINFQFSPFFSGLTAGAYTVHVRDIPYTCHIVVNTTIIEPDALAPFVADRQEVSCMGGADGKLTLMSTGGQPVYSWSADGYNYVLTGVFDGLRAGDHLMYVKDENECTRQLRVTVTEPTQLKARISAQLDVTCNGSGNGRITLEADGGTAPYTYFIDDIGQSVPHLTGILPGHHLLQVIDKLGCEVTLETDMNEPSLLTLSLSSKEDVKCFGRSTGEISVAANGGVGIYTYALNNLATQQQPLFEYLSAGDYLLMVRDENGCTTSLPVNVTQPAPMQFTKSVKHPTCSYATDGNIAVQLSGGVSPYHYEWSNAATAANIEELGGGIYSLQMEDANGCTLTDQTVLIQPAAMVLDMGFKDTTLCTGQQLLLSAGRPEDTFLWQSNTGFEATSQEVLVGEDGDYKVTLTNQAGCIAEDHFTLRTSLTALTAEFLVSSYSVVGDTLIIIDVSRPKPASLSWSMPTEGRDIGSNADGSIRQLVFEKPGTYDIGLLTRLGQCASDMRKSFTVLPQDEQGRVDSFLGYRDKLIKEVSISPNPVSGQFKAVIKLSKEAAIKVKLINFTNGQMLELKQGSGADNYQWTFNMEQQMQGIYLVSVEVGDEYIVKKILKL
jgi:hypothetical protein